MTEFFMGIVSVSAFVAMFVLLDISINITHIAKALDRLNKDGGTRVKP